MQQNYNNVVQKFLKFNEWEQVQNRGKSAARRLQEFASLFELTLMLDAAKREREQARHLQSLIQMQSILRAGSKDIPVTKKTGRR